MKLPKLRELKEAIHALFGRRYTSRFPKAKVELPPGFRGAPKFQEEDCIGCGACAIVCPAKDIEVTDEIKDGRGVRSITIHYDDCIFCAQCHRNCPTDKGVVMTDDFDLASDNRHELRNTVQKELVLCELCNEPIATREHLLWIARRVGTSAYSNPTLMLAMLDKLSPEMERAPKKGEEPGRSDRLRVLCPKCRRDSTIEFSLER